VCLSDVTVGHVCSCILKATFLASIASYLGGKGRDGLGRINSDPAPLLHCPATYCTAVY
jgi:hypothetical protein